MQPKLCSKCKDAPPAKGHKYCKNCKKAYMEKWRRDVKARSNKLKKMCAEAIQFLDDNNAASIGRFNNLTYADTEYLKTVLKQVENFL